MRAAGGQKCQQFVLAHVGDSLKTKGRSRSVICPFSRGIRQGNQRGIRRGIRRNAETGACIRSAVRWLTRHEAGLLFERFGISARPEDSNTFLVLAGFGPSIAVSLSQHSVFEQSSGFAMDCMQKRRFPHRPGVHVPLLVQVSRVETTASDPVPVAASHPCIDCFVSS